MRYILPFSAFVLSCATLFKREEVFPGNMVVVLSRDGNGLCAFQPDTIGKKIRVSVISKGEERTFEYHSRVFLGTYGTNYTQNLVMDSTPISVYTSKFKTGDTVEVLISKNRFLLTFPECNKILEPLGDFLPDWGEVDIKWMGRAEEYIFRVYAFTMMEQRDLLKLVKGQSVSLDLSDLYGDGFLAFQICPINGFEKNRSFKVYALGDCKEKVLIVGDTTVWGGEKPTPPWKKDEVMWYLLNF
ncbi:MAG: hypothetical protein ABIL16_00820 [candidate division WOR-3 bacterium]